MGMSSVPLVRQTNLAYITEVTFLPPYMLLSPAFKF